MTRILIAYDTTEGQTRKIAQHVGKELTCSGCSVEVVDIRRLPAGFSLDGFGAVLVGASIHMGKHSGRLVEFLRRQNARLKAIPTALLSVSLSAAGAEERKADANRFVSELLQQVDWQPTITKTLAGGLLYREYGFLKRWMMKKIAQDAGCDTDTSRNHEYTDWDAVDRFVKDFVVQVEQRRSTEGTSP